MNPYGRLAMDHMVNWLPKLYQTIPDPERHFSALGEAIAARITQEWFALTPRVSGEAPGQTLARVIANHHRAQANVLGEMAWAQPETPYSEDCEVATDLDGGAIGGPPGWMPETLSEEMESEDWDAMLASLGLDPSTNQGVPDRAAPT